MLLVYYTRKYTREQLCEEQHYVPEIATVQDEKSLSNVTFLLQDERERQKEATDEFSPPLL